MSCNYALDLLNRMLFTPDFDIILPLYIYKYDNNGPITMF